MKLWLNVADAAEHAGVCRDTIYTAVERGERAAGDRDIRTGAGEREREVLAEPAARAGDEGDLAGKVEKGGGGGHGKGQGGVPGKSASSF